jgi:CheY-like chemotaxis protein
MDQLQESRRRRLAGENMKRLNILVVEDDDLVAELIGEMLANMKHIVCTTTATQSGAVAAAKFYNPDLMIVDVMLREGNGLDAVDIACTITNTT